MSSRIKVGLDARMWDHPGIGRYLRELYQEMFRLDHGPHLFVLIPKNVMEKVKNNYPGVTFIPSSTKIYSIAEQFELFRFSQKVDFLHVPHFNVPIFSRCPFICTVHDLIYLKNAKHSGSIFGQLYVRFMFKVIEFKAKAVIAVSEFTKKDLLSEFPKLSSKVHVIHEAPAAHFRPIQNVSSAEHFHRKYNLRHPYILFVGSLKPHKNVDGLIRAYIHLKKTHPDLPQELVIVGKADPKQTNLLELIQENSALGVRYLGVVDDDELPYFYSFSDVLVIPSFWEGFGLTVIEAMACKTAVLSSNRASLPEVGGDVALYFNPDDQDEFESQLYKIIADNHLNQIIREKGYKRSMGFSWNKAAHETARLIMNLAQ